MPVSGKARASPVFGYFCHPQLVARLHDVEHPLGGKHREHFAVCFARIGVEIEEGSPGQTGVFTDPDTLVSPLYSRSQDVAGVDEDIVTPTERVALQEQCGLIHAVDDAVGRDVLRCPRQAREGGEQIRLVDDVADGLPGAITPGHQAIAGTRTPPSR